MRMQIRDSGVGMDEATQQQVFYPFFTTKEIGEGTGLGLSTVFGIVKQNGGNIWVESVVGQGTTFSVYLPEIEGIHDTEDQDASHSKEPLHGSETLLLVEDEKAVRKLFRHNLSKGGYIVLEASNGPDALAISNSYPDSIHLLISDAVMPRMSGPALADQLKRKYPAVKVLYVSGYTGDMLTQHHVDEEAMFLQKPFAPDELVRMVRDLLDNGR
ncbi:MAG: response regulator [Gemmatimonadota bacterium]|nr:response regulator [Gemmatimonadota bacterium]